MCLSLVAGTPKIQIMPYEIFQSEKTKKFHFRLKARNGEIILQSEAFMSKQGAQNGVNSSMKHTEDKFFERKKAKDGSDYFVLRASNGEALGRSCMYKSRSGMENGIKSVIKNGGKGAVIKDLVDYTHQVPKEKKPAIDVFYYRSSESWYYAFKKGSATILEGLTKKHKADAEEQFTILKQCIGLKHFEIRIRPVLSRYRVDIRGLDDVVLGQLPDAYTTINNAAYAAEQVITSIKLIL